MLSLQQLREQCTKAEIPIISKQTEIFLDNYIRQHQPQSIIEIGSAVGYSTSVLGESMSSYHPYGEITSWEISYPHYWQALLNTHSYKNIRIFLGNFCHYDCEQILQKGYYDMVFIDGRKSETLLYIEKLSPYLHDTTTIIIDDVIKFKQKMTDWYDFLDKNNIEYEINHLDNDDGILIIPKSQPLLRVLCAQ